MTPYQSGSDAWPASAIFGQYVLSYFVARYRQQYLITMVIGSVIGASSIFMGASGLVRTIAKVGPESPAVMAPRAHRNLKSA